VLLPEQIAARINGAGWDPQESLALGLAVYATLVSPAGPEDFERIVTATAELGDQCLALETAGVVFAFNTVNRVADARRVALEYRWIRELRPVNGWVERRFATLTGLAYDLSYAHLCHHTPDELFGRLSNLVQGLGSRTVPGFFNILRAAPNVLEGVSAMLDVEFRDATVGPNLLMEAAGVAAGCRVMAGSELSEMVDRWLDRASLPDSQTLVAVAASLPNRSELPLAAECRRYAWKVSNAAHTVTDDEIGRLLALGLSDAEILDLTLAAALFSALAVIEPLVRGVAALGPGVNPPPSPPVKNV